MAKETKQIAITDFLTPLEIDWARELYRLCKTGEDDRSFATAVTHDIIEPNIERINALLGQENHPKYLGYCVEFVFSTLSKGK